MFPLQHKIITSLIHRKISWCSRSNIIGRITVFIPAYKFSHYSVEKWINEDFIEITGHTNFEDEREYFINGYENNNSFIAQGMDGKLTLNNKILPSNFWNINMLNQKEIFDTQKGIVREIDVKDLGDEEIIINEKKINCKKFTLNASSNSALRSTSL